MNHGDRCSMTAPACNWHCVSAAPRLHTGDTARRGRAPLVPRGAALQRRGQPRRQRRRVRLAADLAHHALPLLAPRLRARACPQPARPVSQICPSARVVCVRGSSPLCTSLNKEEHTLPCLPCHPVYALRWSACYAGVGRKHKARCAEPVRAPACNHKHTACMAGPCRRTWHIMHALPPLAQIYTRMRTLTTSTHACHNGHTIALGLFRSRPPQRLPQP